MIGLVLALGLMLAPLAARRSRRARCIGSAYSRSGTRTRCMRTIFRRACVTTATSRAEHRYRVSLGRREERTTGRACCRAGCLRVDVIVTVSNDAAQAAKAATTRFLSSWRQSAIRRERGWSPASHGREERHGPEPGSGARNHGKMVGTAQGGCAEDYPGGVLMNRSGIRVLPIWTEARRNSWQALGLELREFVHQRT